MLKVEIFFGSVLILMLYGYANMRSCLLFVSVGRDYVSELRPPVGLLFIPQLIYEYGALLE
jgi:hypothetical protein